MPCTAAAAALLRFGAIIVVALSFAPAPERRKRGAQLCIAALRKRGGQVRMT